MSSSSLPKSNTRKSVKDIVAENAKLEKIDVWKAPHRYAKLNGIDYHYLYFEPDGGKWRETIFLFHGWPDLSVAWRYQIPVLLKLGLRVICPDLPGFGQTAPPPTHLPSYSFKSVATATAELAAQLGADKIILGGHDWGCAVVYRIALWYPQLVTHLFTVCVPYYPPTSVWTTMEERVKRMPSTKYMLDNASGVVEKAVGSPEKIKRFLSGIYGGRNQDGSNGRIWVARKGYDFSGLNEVGPSPWVDEREMEYYVQEYARQGMGPSLNWYRTWHTNYTEELALEPGKRDYTLQPPVLMITASYDDAVLPVFAKHMGDNVKNLTLREVPTSHWALWEGAGQVNGIIEEWIEKVVFGDEKSLGVPEGYIGSKL